MKKLIIFVICLTVILTMVSCSNQNNIVETTTDILSTEHNNTNRTDETEKETSSATSLSFSTTKNQPVSAKSTTSSTSKESVDTVITTETISDNGTNEVPPDILTLNLHNIKQIKNAAETLTEAEFEEYMIENYSSEWMNGMTTRESTINIIGNLKNRYVWVYDGTETGEYLTYYVDDGFMHQLIYLDETQYVNVRLYPDSETSWLYSDGEYSQLIKTYTLENTVVELMKGSDNGTEFLCGNVIIDEQRINFFTKESMTVEEFDEFLSKTEFVKIEVLLENTEISSS